MDGQADHARLLCDTPGDGLADPPGRVGGELEALGVVELLDGADQAGIAFLDEVEHRQLRPGVLARDGDDEPQVGLDELLLGAATFVGEPAKLLLDGAFGGAPIGTCDPAGVEEVLREHPGFDGLAELDFTLGVQERRTGDLRQVHADAVFAFHRLGHPAHLLYVTGALWAVCMCATNEIGARFRLFVTIGPGRGVDDPRELPCPLAP